MIPTTRMMEMGLMKAKEFAKGNYHVVKDESEIGLLSYFFTYYLLSKPISNNKITIIVC